MMAAFRKRRGSSHHRRTGTLGEGRFNPLDGEAYLLTGRRCIELNPVRAGRVAHSGDDRWSSWHIHTEEGGDAWVRPHPLYLALGDTPDWRREAYCSLFREALSEGTLSIIRQAANTAWSLGGDRFKEEVAALTVPGPCGRLRAANPNDAVQGALSL